MIRTPSICGSFLSDKRALVAFTWTIATVMTLLAFFLAVILTCQVHAHYIRQERYWESQMTDDYYRRNNNNEECERGGEDEEGGGGEGENCNGGSQDRNSADRQIEYMLQLAHVASPSMTFVALYIMFMAVGLSLFGSTFIVGFTSVRGDYISPCFSSTGSSKLRLGIFGGAIVMFANLLLLCAVVFGEVRVEDWRQDGNREGGDEAEPYEVEKLATILAVTCMFLAALYTVFSVLLFLYFGNEEIDANTLDETTTHTNKPLVTISQDLRTDKFITMEENST